MGMATVILTIMGITITTATITAMRIRIRF